MTTDNQHKLQEGMEMSRKESSEQVVSYRYYYAVLALLLLMITMCYKRVKIVKL